MVLGKDPIMTKITMTKIVIPSICPSPSGERKKVRGGL
jgi:hypothetical protein